MNNFLECRIPSNRNIFYTVLFLITTWGACGGLNPADQPLEANGGKAEPANTNTADYDCNVVLRNVALLGCKLDGATQGHVQYWQGNVDVAQEKVDSLHTLSILYKRTEDQTWDTADAHPTSLLINGYQQYQFEIQHSVSDCASSVPEDTYQIKLIPFITDTGSTPQFKYWDHNHIEDPMGFYQLDISKSWTLNTDPSTCRIKLDRAPLTEVISCDNGEMQIFKTTTPAYPKGANVMLINNKGVIEHFVSESSKIIDGVLHAFPWEVSVVQDAGAVTMVIEDLFAYNSGGIREDTEYPITDYTAIGFMTSDPACRAEWDETGKGIVLTISGQQGTASHHYERYPVGSWHFAACDITDGLVAQL